MIALYILYGLFLIVLLLKYIIMDKEIEDIKEQMLQMKKDVYEDTKSTLDVVSKHLDSHGDLLQVFDTLRDRIDGLETLVDTLNERYYEIQRAQSNGPVNLMDLPLEGTRYRDYSKEDEPCE